MKLLLGTRNKGKIAEFEAVFKDMKLELVLPDAMGITEDPEETGGTYEQNALLKARFYANASKLPAIADDSGIMVEALSGELGVKTRRWGAGKDATDTQWIAYFLERMVAEENRAARFVSVITFIDNKGEEHVFTGTCDGVISRTLEGEYLPGLPLRSCFKPLGFNRTLSHLTLEEEMSVNHRYKAMMQLKEHLMNRRLKSPVNDSHY